MRALLAALAAAVVLSGPALAQQTGSRTTPVSPGPGASNQNGSRNPAAGPETTGAVEAGANSFTEGQARSRMEAQGFTNIQGLAKNEQGIWHGRAMQNGRPVEVMLDYRGHIATR
ncbi:hypothetical protein [Microvirga massiliensis]|uniref:hypothetical protein n=1 Tax=Microvirga massiliensis TaxID=1033741 RepID=UPI00062B44CC|nr:hypothetical protein [Microvirga massiliensis]